MAERLDLNQPRYSEFSQSIADDTLFNPEMGSIYGSLQKGDEANPYMMNPDELIAQGNSQYGITPWANLWGDQGQLLDQQGLLRSLNATGVFGQAPMNVGNAQRQYGSSASPPQVTISLEQAMAGGPSLQSMRTMQLAALQNWQNGGSGYGQSGLAGGFSGAQNQALAGGADPNLVNWLGGINDFNDSINDPRERFFDPNNLSFGMQDFGGMDLGSATQDSLNAWAQQNYGTDLMGLANMGSELSGMRYDMLQDPSQYWDKNTGMLTSLSLPGMSDVDAGIKRNAYNLAYGEQQENADIARGNAYSDQMNQALLTNPELMRTGYGQYLAGTMGLSQNLASQAGQRIQQPGGYEQLLYQFGIAPQNANAALAQMGMSGGMYG